MFVTAVFLIPRLVLLTFQFTTWNNVHVSLYTKILDWLEQKLGGGLSPLGLAT